MSNAVITPSGGGYAITGSQRVHVELQMDLSGGIGAEAEFTVAFPLAPVPVLTLVRGAESQAVTFAAAPPDPSPTFTNRTVSVAHSDAAGTRTVTFVIGDTSLAPSPNDVWTLKITGLSAVAGTTSVTPSLNVTGLAVEADVFLDAPALPATAFAQQVLALSAKARRNRMPLPTTLDYNPPAPALSWAGDAPITAGSLVVAPATFAAPAADGYSATASVVIPPLAVATPLAFTFTATFGEFTGTFTGTVQAQPLNHYWLIALDRSNTMGTAGAVKWGNAKAAANLWADIVSAFRLPGATQDRIGVLTFDDAGSGFRSATPAASVQIRWPGAAMGAVASIGDPSMDGLKVGGADVLGSPAQQTPLGDGLVKSLDEMLAVGGGAGSTYELMVVSDGVENTGTVKVDAASPISNAALAQTFDAVKSAGSRAALSFGAGGNVRLYPVGTTAPAPGNTTTLNLLGGYGLGPYPMSAGLADLLSTAFGSALFSTLGASQVSISLGVLDNTNFPDPAPVGAGKQVYFLVPAGDDKLVVAVLCNNSARDRTLKLTRRQQLVNGPFQALPAAAVTYASRDRYLLAVVDLAQLSNVATEWRVAVDRTSGGVTQEPVAATDVLAGRDLRVRATVAFDRDSYFNDEPMVVRTSLFAGGRAITDAVITVEVEGPAVSEGELLAANPKLTAPPTKPELALTADGVPSGSREAALARVLARSKQSAIPTVRYKSVFIDGTNVLQPEGGQPGHYGNVFVKNWREGRYDFRFTIAGRTEEGAFSDVQRVSRMVRLRVDDAASPVSVGEMDARAPEGLRAARVTVTPTDAMGQRLGPFHIPEVEFDTSSGTFLGAVESDYDGSYSQAFLYPASHRPVVTVRVQGRALTPVLVSPDLVGTVAGLLRRALSWVIRYARSA